MSMMLMCHVEHLFRDLFAQRINSSSGNEALLFNTSSHPLAIRPFKEIESTISASRNRRLATLAIAEFGISRIHFLSNRKSRCT
jgi:hypothetical protein